MQLQSTPAHGGRPSYTVHNRTVKKGFNPRPRTAGDKRRLRRFGKRWSFNPRPRTAGDNLERSLLCLLMVFQSTPAHGGRQKKIAEIREALEFQSTPAHGGRQSGAIAAVLVNGVSIHARARRATLITFIFNFPMICFNPRPRTAGDSVVDHPQAGDFRFQSTPAHGGRLAEKLYDALELIVSIHARARRATSGGTTLRWPCKRFNPRPRTAGDRSIASVKVPFTGFQSTPAHGGRLYLANELLSITEFQSTPAHGGRHPFSEAGFLC